MGPPSPPSPSPRCPLDRERPGERSRGALSLSLSGESPAAPSSSLFTSSFSFPYSRPLPLPACSASSPSRPLLCKSARIALASTTRAFRCTLLRGPPVLLSLPSTSPSSLPPASACRPPPTLAPRPRRLCTSSTVCSRDPTGVNALLEQTITLAGALEKRGNLVADDERTRTNGRTDGRARNNAAFAR